MAAFTIRAFLRIEPKKEGRGTIEQGKYSAAGF